MSTKSYQKRLDIYHSLTDGKPVRQGKSPVQVLAWSPQFETGIPEIDQLHRTLVQFVNEIGDLLEVEMEATVKSLFGIFDELVKYADCHFRLVEKLLWRNLCEQQHHAASKLAYADFVRQICQAGSKVCDHPAETAGRMLALLPKWLTTHILVTDMQVARLAVESDAQTVLRAGSAMADFGMAMFDAMSSLHEKRAERTFALLKSEYGCGTDITKRFEHQQKLRRQGMTKLCSQNQFFELAEQELARSKRYGKQLSLLMMHLDECKSVNATYGVSDNVLRKVGEACRMTLREIAIVARIGTDEFAILLPESDALQAVDVAQRLRGQIAHSVGRMELCDGYGMTASVGIATLSASDATIERLHSLADKALHQAKNSGNKVCVAE